MDISNILRIYNKFGKLISFETAPPDVAKHQLKFSNHFICVWSKPSKSKKLHILAIFCECGKCFYLDDSITMEKENCISFAKSLKQRVLKNG